MAIQRHENNRKRRGDNGIEQEYTNMYERCICINCLWFCKTNKLLIIKADENYSSE